MMIDQRNAGASVTIPASTVTYTLDRWYSYANAASKFSVQRNAGSITPPIGFINYLGATSLSSYTVGANEEFDIAQPIEGLNVADLGWGTANAQTVTISFYVRSSLTGTFGGAVQNSASNRSYPFTYTISAANTWEQKTITVAGDTSGTWLTTNGIGLILNFCLGAGSSKSGTAGAWGAGNFVSATGATSVVGTSGATFYITGVQLEKGSTATSFDYRPYGTELALCQRYYWKITGGGSFFGVCPIAGISANAAVGIVQFPVPMRTSPTGITVSGTFTAGSAGFNPTLTIDTGLTNTFCLGLTATATGSIAQYRAYNLISLGSAANFIEVLGTEL
jgi:hypothetical protein